VKATKLGEVSLGAVDFGLIAYVRLLGDIANVRVICYMREISNIILCDFSAFFSGEQLDTALALKQEFYHDIIRVHKR